MLQQEKEPQDYSYGRDSLDEVMDNLFVDA